MITITQALFLLAAASSVVAAPAEQKGSKLTIPQVKNPEFKGKNGYVELAKTLTKYGKPLPSGLQKHVDHHYAKVQVKTKGHGNDSGKGGTASAPATSKHDTEWLVPVTIGSKKVNLDFDTGSSDLWIQGKLYDGKGKTLPGLTWSIQYLDKTGASGKVVSEDVSIGGFTVTGQSVEIATKTHDPHKQFGDGLVGLAFNTINTVEKNGQKSPQKTWVDNFCKQSGATDCVFTADLGSGARPGSYNFGYVDKSYGNITYVDCDTSAGWYMFDITAANNNSRATIVADTGTTLALVTREMAEAYYSQVNGAQFDDEAEVYTFDCGTKLPDFKFKIGEHEASIPAKFMSLDAGDGGNTCTGGVTYSSRVGCTGGDDSCPVGDAWLKSIYAVFDYTNGRFGWSVKDTGN